MVNDSNNPCVFCRDAGGEIVWSNTLARVVNINNEDHPAFCRVILQRHAREMTDLSESERAGLMRIVFAAEQAQRQLLEPEKINLACFGNMVPHVHWHVIPRFRLDPHYPNPVWGSSTAGTPQALPDGYWASFYRELVNQLGLSA